MPILWVSLVMGPRDGSCRTGAIWQERPAQRLWTTDGRRDSTAIGRRASVEHFRWSQPCPDKNREAERASSQQLAGKIPWGRNMLLLDKLDTADVRTWCAYGATEQANLPEEHDLVGIVTHALDPATALQNERLSD
jgi:hypothetical protein